MSANPSRGKNLPEWQAYQETLPWTAGSLGWWDRRLVASDRLIEALLRELDGYQALVENLSGEVERLAYLQEGGSLSCLDAPTIRVKWANGGWTNTKPVRLLCETDGYIDWPVTLNIVEAP